MIMGFDKSELAEELGTFARSLRIDLILSSTSIVVGRSMWSNDKRRFSNDRSVIGRSFLFSN